VHFADADTNQRGGKVTGSGGLQGGKALGRGARLRIDLHRKDRQLRGLIAKANELGEQGTVVQFTRQATAGLIDPDTGEKIDLAQEKALERKQRLEQQHAEARARARKSREEREAEKRAAKVNPVEPEAQLDLTEINRKLNEAAVEKPSGWGLSLVDPQAREGDE
jgi:phage protein D